MKKLLLAALVLFFAPLVSAQTFINSNVAGGTAPTCVVPITGTNIGDTIILDSFVIGSTAITSVKDQLGNAVPLLLGPTTWSTNGQFTERLYSVANKSGGTVTLTVTLAATIHNECYAYDYANLTGLDAVATPVIGAGAVSGFSNAVTTTNANDMLFAFFHSDGNAVNTAGAGFAGRPSSNPNAEDKKVTSAGAYTAPMSFAPATNYVAFLVAFKAVPGHSVTLSWTPSAGCVVTNPPATTCNPAFQATIYRGTASGAETQLASAAISSLPACPATAPAGSLCFVDAGVVSGATYFYQVTETNSCSQASCESGKSNEATATIPSGTLIPNAPPNLQGVPQ